MTGTNELDAAAILNDHLDGWCSAMGLLFDRATADEVVASWIVGPQHLQACGIVHGGVHCGVIETLASVGAELVAMARGQTVVWLENHTSFIRATREGQRRTVTARPLTRGRSTQVWEASVVNEAGKLVATGRVRVLCVEPGAELGGKPVEPRT